METHQGDIYTITESGKLFLTGNEKLEAFVDQKEGLIFVLSLISENNPARRGELLPAFSEYCRDSTTFQSDIVIRTALYERLINLQDRNFISRSGVNYGIEELGVEYLENLFNSGTILDDETKINKARRLVREMYIETREELMQHLLSMDPFKFEHLIKLVLEEIGYTDVTVTSPTNDKGVDVVANIELGISSVREVVQVKRYQITNRMTRRTLDELRGSLHRFNAVRGSIITTGDFSSGALKASFEKNAAPITLINGEKLLDLMVANEIGIKKNSLDYFLFDAKKIMQFEENVEEIDE
ncbi:MAG: hypothetical protein BGO78_14390 [Chloroflexi bacterium 44-23]|nr:MAG: hypothetical protein BGO78_14390 [Chloroflexi bacterium 44-23]